MNRTKFEPPPSFHTKRRALALDMSNVTHWRVSFSCRLSADQIDLLVMAVPLLVSDCYVQITGNGERVSAALLVVPCLQQKTSATLIQLMRDAMPPNDPCVTGPLFMVLEDVAVAVRPSSMETTEALLGLTQTQTPVPWHLDRIDSRTRVFDNKYNYAYTGENVTIYVTDTGALVTHDDFEGRASIILDLVDPPCYCDCNGHGTHCMAIAGGKKHGVAKNAILLMLRVLGCNGNGYLSNVIMALIEIADRQMANPHTAVLSMSIAGPADALLDAYVNTLVTTHRVVVVVAAGNDAGNAGLLSPARASQAVTVAATTIYDTATEFTNLGSVVDIAAPGNYIVSAWHTSNNATNTLRGTSQATPQAAGVAALLIQRTPGIDAIAIRTQLLAIATAGPVRIAGTLPLLFSGVDVVLPPAIAPSPLILFNSPSVKVPTPPGSVLSPTPTPRPSPVPTPVAKVITPSPRPPPPPPPPPSYQRPWWMVPGVSNNQPNGGSGSGRSFQWKWTEIIADMFAVLLFWWV